MRLRTRLFPLVGTLVVVSLGVPEGAALAGDDAPTEARTFGFRTGGGYSFVALASGGANSPSAAGSSAMYPPLELQIFNRAGESFDVSVPVGAMVYAATNHATAFGAGFHYSPSFGDGYVRAIASPGIGWAYVSQGDASANVGALGVRLGLEILGADQHLALGFFCEPTFDFGSVSSGGASVGVFGAGLTLLATFALYETGSVAPDVNAHKTEDETEPPVRSVPRPSAPGPQATTDLSVCGRVFDRIDDVADRWVNEHPGRSPADTLPSREAFLRVCGRLPEDVQICLNPSYEEGHRESCAEKIGALHARDRLLLDELFLAPPREPSP
jgi:hypothetical protein